MNDMVVALANHPSPYEVRRMMMNVLNQSQQIEHEFFEQCRETVRRASTRLTDHFSELIQREMPQWSEPECREFARHSGVSMDAITRWKAGFDTLARARAEAARAEVELKAATAAKSDTGGIFGAKRGYEEDYRAASGRHAVAEAALRTAQDRAKSCTKSATAAAEAVLRDCVACAGALAEATGCTASRVPREIMLEAAKRAKELTATHEHEQSKLNSNLSAAANFLGHRYGVAHE